MPRLVASALPITVAQHGKDKWLNGMCIRRRANATAQSSENCWINGLKKAALPRIARSGQMVGLNGGKHRRYSHNFLKPNNLVRPRKAACSASISLRDRSNNRAMQRALRSRTYLSVRQLQEDTMAEDQCNRTEA